MATLKIDIQIYCSQCNSRLKGSFANNEILDIEPCIKCMEESYAQGHDDGYFEGVAEKNVI